MSNVTQPAATPDARTLNEQGARALAGGDPDAAISSFRQALAHEPAQPAIWLNLAAAQRARSDIGAALQSVDAALRLEPRHFMALLSKASLLERKGARKAAAVAYGIALTQAPPDARLDVPTLNVVRRAREISHHHTADLEQFIGSEISDDLSQCSAPDAKRINAFIGLTLGLKENHRQKPALFFYPGLPAVEFYERKDFSWLADLEAATDSIREEVIQTLASDLDRFVPYIDYPDTVPLDQWAMLNQSREWSAYHLIHQGEIVEEAARRCPMTIAAIKLLPQPHVAGKSPAAMFSALRPHTRIPAHNGIANTRLVVHLPLIVPEDCGFRVGNETRQWEEGRAWVFDDTIEHEAWNDSDRLRTILICDIWHPRLSEDERALIGKVMTAMDVFNESATDAAL